MIDTLLEPLSYAYMVRALWMSALVGASCAFLSCYLMLKGWSLMGDALAHAVVPGTALAYLFGLPYAVGAFFSGLLAALSMLIVKQKTKLKEDAVIGLVFTGFFAAGLLLISINPVAVSIQSIILGNILAMSDADMIQVTLICILALGVLTFFWRDFAALFFDEAHAKSMGLPVLNFKILFFVLLSAVIVAALQAVGAALVIAMVITPGATAYLLTDRFGKLIMISVGMGVITSLSGVYLSYFLDGATGGVIVCLQTLLFFTAFLFAPKQGLLRRV